MWGLTQPMTIIWPTVWRISKKVFKKQKHVAQILYNMKSPATVQKRSSIKMLEVEVLHFIGSHSSAWLYPTILSESIKVNYTHNTIINVGDQMNLEHLGDLFGLSLRVRWWLTKGHCSLWVWLHGRVCDTPQWRVIRDQYMTLILYYWAAVKQTMWYMYSLLIWTFVVANWIGIGDCNTCFVIMLEMLSST